MSLVVVWNIDRRIFYCNGNPSLYQLPSTVTDFLFEVIESSAESIMAESQSKQTAMSSTFVTTDRHNFKETVQRLTGLSEGENEKLPLTISTRNSNRGSGIPEIKSDGICFEGMKNMIELGSQNSSGNRCSMMKNMIDLCPQKSNGNRCGGMKNMIDLGPQKSNENRGGGMKNMIDLGPQKSNGNSCGGMIELGPQKRRKVERKLEIKLGLNAMKLGGHKSVLMPSPISPLGADLFSSYSQSPSYSSTPTSCNQSSYLEEEVEEFCFRSLPNQKSEPKLLTLFPLNSSTQNSNT